MAWRNEEPARSALAIRVIVSGSCLLNALRRLDLRRPSQKRGSMNPISAPTTQHDRVAQGREARPRGPASRPGRRSWCPTQITMYSDGLSCRSARAISRARLAPKSRCSTTLLSWVSAWLDAIAAARPPSPDGRRAGRLGLGRGVALEAGVDARAAPGHRDAHRDQQDRERGDAGDERGSWCPRMAASRSASSWSRRGRAAGGCPGPRTSRRTWAGCRSA